MIGSTGGCAMHMFIMVLLGTLWALTVVAGISAIATGWVVPWMRGRIVRPRLWGCGALLTTAGMALFQYGSEVRGMTTVDVVFGCAMVVFVTGCVLQYLGQRPGRVPA